MNINDINNINDRPSFEQPSKILKWRTVRNLLISFSRISRKNFSIRPPDEISERITMPYNSYRTAAGEISCTAVMNCFVRCGFSNFVGPRPESASELNKHILLAETHDIFECVDENPLYYYDRKDVCDVMAQNILKNVSLRSRNAKRQRSGC